MRWTWRNNNLYGKVMKYRTQKTPFETKNRFQSWKMNGWN